MTDGYGESPLAAYYGRGREHARLSSRHGSVEFLTTMRFAEKYLFPGAKIIEIGAGTGRYSLALAEAGFEVDAVELLDCNIEVFKENLRNEKRVRIAKGDALDLSRFKSGSFDLTLLLGPLYHLYAEEDKRRAVSEALRVTRSGGTVFAAYCLSDAALIQTGFNEKGFGVAEYIAQGKINPDTFDTLSTEEDVFEIVRKEDIDNLMKGFEAERLHYVSTDLFTHYIGGAVDAMDDEEFELYLRYHFSVCERPDMAGISNHVLDIFRKN